MSMLIRSLVQRPCLIRCFSIRPLQFIYHRSFITLPDSKDGEAIMSMTTHTDPHALLKQLAHQGRSQQAQKLYDTTFRHTAPDPIVYRYLILSYIYDGQVDEAMSIYYELRDHQSKKKANSQVLNEETYVTMIQALATVNHHDTTKNGSHDDVYWSLEGGNEDDEPRTPLAAMMTLFKDMRHYTTNTKPETITSMYIELVRFCGKYQDSEALARVRRWMGMDIDIDWTSEVALINECLKAYRSVRDALTACELWEMYGGDAKIVLEACLEQGLYKRGEWIKQKM
ncbi:uncharacterized protein BX663DRAFT_508812 [Cokeromyces recurvatus]|uniref:uncharacterized protein n=1 Tax=Cokeromyces recurvatus TaxID=90255 RepID=UPI00221F1D67|nr:uncharacterized protein BX663DRAFT_508812 [Cokeromyces recurvatus]KAI7902905.1 hypothetical protein BX663DRAFT_508812 [Cokeromyces recurvatus]